MKDNKIKHIVDVKWIEKPDSAENEVYLAVLYFTVGNEMVEEIVMKQKLAMCNLAFFQFNL